MQAAIDAAAEKQRFQAERKRVLARERTAKAKEAKFEAAFTAELEARGVSICNPSLAGTT